MIKRFYVATLLMLFVAVMNVSAQVTTASMSGKVLDGNEPIIGATVNVTHEPSGTTVSTASNTEGSFYFQGLRTGGPYRVEVSYIGYKKAIVEGIRLNLGETYSLNIPMESSSQMLGEVVITANKANEKQSTNTSISSHQLTTLPTISRSIDDFTKLSPFAGGSNSFAGRDGRYNNVTIDGASLNNRFGLSSNNFPSGDAQPISLDAIEEISVNVSPFDVKYSSFTGASINAVTKSGTNEFKGSVYTYQKPRGFLGGHIGDNDIVNSDVYRSSIYGLTLGGPILKNKLFFFISGELENSQSPGILWKPSTNGEGDNANHISRTTYSDLETMSNFLKKTYNYDPGQYSEFDPFQSKNWKLMARVDYNINPRHNVSLRFNTVNSNNDQSISSTSSVITRTNAGRYSTSAFAFGNSNYKYRDIVTSISGEWNGRFSDKVQNKMIATYTHIVNTRDTKGDDMPMVDIWKDGTQYMTFGTELFTPFNKVENNVFSITDNVNISLGDHFLTAGASFEYQYFMNSYLRAPFGYYRYNSMEDFMEGKTPALYGITYGYNGEDAPGAELSFGMTGVYLQDEWSLLRNFKLTYGLRIDVPTYLDDVAGNQAILNETFLNGERVDVSKWPSAKVLWSPRVGFNWDVMDNHKIVVSGGTGIFTGMLPFVWFTNQPTNAGQLQNMVEFEGSELPAGFKYNPNYKETLKQYPQLFPSKPGSEVPGAIAFVDPDFKLPQVWRTSLNVDFQLPYDFTLTVGGMYTRDIYNVVQKNINLPEAQGVYQDQPGRVYWTDKYVNDKTNTVIKLTNGDKKGYQYSFNAVLTKKLDFGLTGSFGYTYTMAKDLTSNPGSSAASVWQNNVAVNSLNDAEMGYSLFSTPHRLMGNVSYEIKSGIMKSTFSVFYTGYQQGRYSYTYYNDMNGDGNYSDLIYIPKTKDEMTFVDYTDKSGNVTYSAAQQQEDFWNYVNNDKYLKNHKGEYAERGAGLLPWIHRFDFRYAQDYDIKIGNRMYGLQLNFTVLNIGNLFKSTWGAYSTSALQSYDNFQVLSAKVSKDKRLTYQINSNRTGDTHESFMENTTWQPNATTGSAWQMQVGLKFSF